MAASTFAFEAHGKTAVLYLNGALREADEVALCRAGFAFPTTVRDLRIDARALHTADARTRVALRALIHFWRRTRGGGLSLLASARALGADVAASATPAPVRLLPTDPALSGTFL